MEVIRERRSVVPYGFPDDHEPAKLDAVGTRSEGGSSIGLQGVCRGRVPESACRSRPLPVPGEEIPERVWYDSTDVGPSRAVEEHGSVNVSPGANGRNVNSQILVVHSIDDSQISKARPPLSWATPQRVNVSSVGVYRHFLQDIKKPTACVRVGSFDVPARLARQSNREEHALAHQGG
jgi:hypothetical protein